MEWHFVRFSPPFLKGRNLSVEPAIDSRLHSGKTEADNSFFSDTVRRPSAVSSEVIRRTGGGYCDAINPMTDPNWRRGRGMISVVIIEGGGKGQANKIRTV